MLKSTQGEILECFFRHRPLTYPALPHNVGAGLRTCPDPQNGLKRPHQTAQKPSDLRRVIKPHRSRMVYTSRMWLYHGNEEDDGFSAVAIILPSSIHPQYFLGIELCTYLIFLRSLIYCEL